jgi:hypothetical protein
MPLVSISDAQRAPLPNANFLATIHHGIPLSLHEASYRAKGGYVAFMGRISPEKGQNEMASRSGNRRSGASVSDGQSRHVASSHQAS